MSEKGGRHRNLSAPAQFHECLFTSVDDYRKFGKWVGNDETLDKSCSNPKALFESIATKPEDLFEYIRYKYFDGSNDTKDYAISLSSKIRSHVDTDYYGRCFTFKPTEKMIKSGINRIYLSLRKSSFVFFHMNGMFDTKVEIIYFFDDRSLLYQFITSFPLEIWFQLSK